MTEPDRRLFWIIVGAIVFFTLVLAILIILKPAAPKEHSPLQSKFISAPGALQTKSKNKITIITMEDRPLGDMLSIHNTSVENYAKHHGYDYRFTKTFDSPLPVYWKKLHWMQEIMDENQCDYVLWMDSDTMVCNPWVPIEAMISLKPDAAIFIGRDWPFWSINALCAGVFLVKNDQVGKRFISECLNKAVNNPACLVGDKPVLQGVWAGECYEQGVMNQFLKKEFSENLCIVGPEFICNSGMKHCRFDSLFLHCFGAKDRTLLAFKRFIAQDRKLPIVKNPRPLKVAILLTMHGLPERRSMYSQVLSKWLNKTQLPIFIIDSAGNELFNENHSRPFKYHSFQQTDQRVSPGFEPQSLAKAFEFFENEFQNFDLICKITGKYFIADLEHLISFILDNAELVLQNRTDTLGQNSEIFMIKPSLFPKLLSSQFVSTEEKLVDFNNQTSPQVIHLPPLPIDNTFARNDGKILNWL